MQTRYEERQKKRKQNIVLNSLIVIVFIGIIIVGAQLLSRPASEQETSSPQDKSEMPALNEDEDKVADTGTEEETDSTDEVQVEEQGDYRFVGGGPDGPWEPIGTKQTGEHTTQFTKGSLDWEEMTLALAYGAGIDHETMTVIWLGNGGSPERAKGQVKSNDEQNTIYHVTIEWVDNEGWKPIDVFVEG